DYKALLENLYRLIDSCGSILKSVVNEMYDVMLKYNNSKEESLEQLSQIEFLRKELSTFQFLYG
ncbi:hypothetical protein MKX01_022649, partial [Papaver californicum]